MSYQAPAQSFGPPSRLGGAVGEERIRRLLEERQSSGLDFDPMARLAVSPAQSIVAQEQARPEQPSTEDIVASESAGRPKSSPKFEASSPQFPVTSVERQAPARASENARRLVEAQGPSSPAAANRGRLPARPMSPAEIRLADKNTMPALPSAKPLSVRGPAPSGAAPEPIAISPAQGVNHPVRNEAKDQELMARYNAAVDDGDFRKAQEALSALEAERRKFATPGQEQETQDVVVSALDRLSEAQQEAILGHFQRSADSSMNPEEERDTFDAAIRAMDMEYGDLPLSQIIDAMAADANRLIVNANPELGVGELRGTFAPRSASQARPVGDTTGIPTTHRRLPTQGGQNYPTVTGPNGEGYGTFEDVGGSLSLAAPQTSLIELASKVGSTPPKIGGPDGMTAADMRAWEEAMIQAAVASGLDVQKFRNRGEIVRAGQEMLRRHEQLTDKAKGFPAGRYEVQYNPTGRPIYAPTTAMREHAEEAKKRAHAHEFVRTFNPPEAIGLAIREASANGQWDDAVIQDKDGNDVLVPGVRTLMQRARNDRSAATAAATREMGAMRGRTQNMNNPAVAPAMFEQSIMNAESPEEMGRVLTAWSPVIGAGAAGLGSGMMMQSGAQEAAREEARLDRESAERVGMANAAARDKEDAKSASDILAGIHRNVDANLSSPEDIDANWASSVQSLAIDYKNANIARPEDSALYHVAGVVASQGLVGHAVVTQAMQNLFSNLFPGPVQNTGGAVLDKMRQEWDKRKPQFLAKTRAMNIPDAVAVRFLENNGVK
jgi:hypothetical protein